jgi:very-short-patch-repair endonuclease
MAVDVTVSGNDPGRRPGVNLHCARRLDAREVRRRKGIPLTAPARTVLDLAEVLSRRDLERAIEEAQIHRLTGRNQLFAQLERSTGRRGAAMLRDVLEAEAGPSMTRSEAEERVLALLRAADLQPTAVNTRIGRYEVDMLWAEQRLVAEVDGYAYHGTRAAFERDRLRDGELQALGFRVMRITWRQLQEHPEEVVTRLARALAS